jgi:hypothetical protein
MYQRRIARNLQVNDLILTDVGYGELPYLVAKIESNSFWFARKQYDNIVLTLKEFYDGKEYVISHHPEDPFQSQREATI